MSIRSFVSETETRPIAPDELVTLEPRDQLGRFRIEYEVGHGGCGRVYKAFDTHLDRFVALKIPRSTRFNGQLAEAFFREAKAAARLRDNNIVSVYEIGHANGRIFIVSDFIEGDTLDRWREKENPSQIQSAQMVSQLARSIHNAHQSGIVHRDLKPTNVIVAPQGVPFITDFGLAKNEQLEEFLGEGIVVGTPAYMSPEQARGDGADVDCRTDIYSLGVILYELLTGQRPFEGPPKLVIDQVIQGDVCPLRQIEQSIQHELELICLKAINKSPHLRFENAIEFSRRLDVFVARIERQNSREAKPIRARFQGLKSLAFALVCVAVAIGLGVLQANSPPTLIAERNTVPPRPKTRAYINIQAPDGKGINNEITSMTLLWQPDYLVYGIVQRIENGVYGSNETSREFDVNLTPGNYAIRVEHPKYGILEVRRTVPELQGQVPTEGINNHSWLRIADGRVHLPSIRFVESTALENDNLQLIDGQQLIRVKKGSFLTRYESKMRKSLALPRLPLVETTVPSFHLGQYEVTVEQFSKIMGYIPKRMKSRFESDVPMDLPVTNVSYYEALEYCERVGGRLPTVDECAFVATNAGQTKFPWGDDEKYDGGKWLTGAVGMRTYDRTQHTPPIEGLFSSVAEWTSDTFMVDTRSLDPNGKNSKRGSIQFSDTIRLTSLSESKVIFGGDHFVKFGHFERAGYFESARSISTGLKSYTRFNGLGFRVAK